MRQAGIFVLEKLVGLILSSLPVVRAEERRRRAVISGVSQVGRVQFSDENLEPNLLKHLWIKVYGLFWQLWSTMMCRDTNIRHWYQMVHHLERLKFDMQQIYHLLIMILCSEQKLGSLV